MKKGLRIGEWEKLISVVLGKIQGAGCAPETIQHIIYTSH